MKRVLAVSGGVDSMVMLDILRTKFPSSEIIVAHFDHGIRGNSHEDAEFVRQKAAEYHLEFQLGSIHLGSEASEAEARVERYNFLRQVAGEEGIIYTAHHLDDLAETMAINFTRGTGWRGLGCLDSPGVVRPFLSDYREIGFTTPPTKSDLLSYAARYQLTFREDPTNNSDDYLRNQLRNRLDLPLQDKLELYRLWKTQLNLKQEIYDTLGAILPEDKLIWPRQWFLNLADATALEILRFALEVNGLSATRPQLRNFLDAIRTYAPGKFFNLPEDNLVKITRADFRLSQKQKIKNVNS